MNFPRIAISFWFVAVLTASAEPWDKYLWETWRTTKIPKSSNPLEAELSAEIQRILEAGPLAPIRTVYADLEQDPYFMYWQGGRIITTLAMAWPWVDAAQQSAIRKYVRAELDDETRGPWSPNGFIPSDSGARRELHTFHEARGWDRYWHMWGNKKPVAGSLYGLWLYADRAGDWEPIKAHYSQLANLYARKIDQCVLYGTMGANIAMARIARHFNDLALKNLAVSNSCAAFQTGTNFDLVETATKEFWNERYQPRQRRGVYQGWMFLDLCPEVGRYLADHVQEPVLERHREGLKMYPLFWLREVPYNSRWTGDEGLGIPTELMGMIVPVERWVANASPDTLKLYTRSAPICIGDCYWIEGLINAIEATGKTEWIEVRP
ncbi:MAG TPA: hypothetical protein VGR78_12635 [Verrucomicrobiae bacterium]|jgi:hypothetical protein|nr:hypothetical protein [Verrucomicrobiae bacterium]